MLKEVKHLGREREVSIVPEGTYDGQILRFAQDDNHPMTSDGAPGGCRRQAPLGDGFADPAEFIRASVLTGGADSHKIRSRWHWVGACGRN